MSQNNPQNEIETVNHLLSEEKTDEQRYSDAIDPLSWHELKAECIKQYRLSGQSLDKYRTESQRRVDAQAVMRDRSLEVARLRSQLRYSKDTVNSTVERLSAIRMVSSESAGYTQNAKNVVRNLIDDIARGAIEALREQLGSIAMLLDRNVSEFDDLPF